MCMMFKLSAYEAQSNVECKSERPGTWGQFETISFLGYVFVLLLCVCLQAIVWYYMQSYSVECYNSATFYLLDAFKNRRKKSQLPFWPLTSYQVLKLNHCSTFRPLR